MKKNIEWLKKEIEEYLEYEGVRDARIALESVLGYIDQLDEPKTLSQEWIDEHEQCITGLGADKNSMSQYHHAPFVSVYDLQNLLVPKQDKRVIPQFVADYIEKMKYKGLTMYEWFSFGNNDVDDDVNKWLYNNLNVENRRREDLLFNAIRFGYKVEKEKLYYAKIKGHELVETGITIEDGRDVSEWSRNVYFVLQKDGQIIVDMKDSGLSGAKHVMTMSQWNDLGINETNADFEEAN